MSRGNLIWLGGLLLAIGALPFISVGIAHFVLSGAGCFAADGSALPCAQADNPLLANMLLAGWYVILSVPIGIVGILLLLIGFFRR